MTEYEQKEWDLKLREMDARIANLYAQTEKINQENNKMFDAEIAKLIAETTKINKESKWYLVLVASSATLAIVAFTKIFL